MDRPVRMMSWNVQGGRGLDLASAARIIDDARVDLVALQEVQRRQTARLAGLVSMEHRWAFKHWPIVHRPEGLAVLSRRPLVRAERFVLRRAPAWTWRRRVGLDATIGTAGGAVRVLVVHLSPHDHEDERRREAAFLSDRLDGAVPAVVLGDLNELPGSAAVATLRSAGWRDAWSDVHGDAPGGATNWTTGDRRGRPASQRLDYVLAPPGSLVEDARVINVLEGAAGVEMGDLSDHLPLVVALSLRSGAS